MALALALPGPGAQAQTDYLQNLQGIWDGQGRAASSNGEMPIRCAVEGAMQSAQLTLTANCATQGQSGTLGMVLYFSDMSRQFHGQMTGPLVYLRGALNGRLDRGDLFLRLAAEDGSEGRLLLVAEGPDSYRLLVTTIVEGASVTVLDLPLQRSG